jgi:mRNA-degrading endonuclease RelE of RelBE toxin-antitoxin system
MIIHITHTFKNAAKKLPAKQKLIVEDAIEKIADDPDIGEQKKGDLAGVFVHKFKIHHQLMLLAYTYHKTGKQDILTLLSLGTHENFYRNLKK